MHDQADESAFLRLAVSQLSPPLLGGRGHHSRAVNPVVGVGLERLVLLAVAWTLGWTVLFYVLSWIWPRLRIPASAKAHENCRYWCARNVIGILHAMLVGGLSVVSLMFFLGAADEWQFASSNDLATCAVPGASRELDMAAQGVALAGLAFTTFTLADLFISAKHGFASVDYVIHHVAFISAGVVIRGHCMLPLNASILLAMEVSTPFLNWVTLFRHRGGYNLSVVIAGVCFLATFIMFRVVLNTYGAAVLWTFRKSSMPPNLSGFEAWFLIVVVSIGALLQLFWLKPITRMFCDELKKLHGEAEGSTVDGRDPAKRQDADVGHGVSVASP